jgi:hypothetical protein
MSLSLNNSTIVPLLSGEVFLGKTYDNILDFAEINIAIKCDVGYTLTYIYSQDKLSVDYETSQAIVAQIDTQFYKLPVNDRYFKLKIEATDGDMSVLNVQTIYKSVPTFNNSGSGPTSNVAITAPLNGDGSVKVGGSLTLGGNVNANITNTSLDVAVNNFPSIQDVNITNSSIPVSNTNLDNIQFDSQDNLKVIVENAQLHTYVDNLPSVQDVNITNSYINVGNFPATQNVNLSNITTNSSLNVSDSTSHTYLNTVVSDLNKLTFDSDNNLYVNLNSINSNFVDAGNNNGLKVAIQNSSLAITNSALSNMSFNSGALKVNDTQNSYTSGALNVSDSTTHTTLSNIYTCVNTRGSGVFINGSIVMDGYTSVIDLSIMPVKCLTIYGNCSSDTTLTVLFSQNNSSFYQSQYSYTIPVGGSNFGFAINACPKYICLQSSKAVSTLQAYLDYS